MTASAFEVVLIFFQHSDKKKLYHLCRSVETLYRVFVFPNPHHWPWRQAPAPVPGPNLYIAAPVLNLYLLALAD